MKISMSKSSRIVLPVSALCLLFLALIWVSYFRQRSFDKKNAVRFAVEKNSNLAVALEQYAISTLNNANAVLQLVRLEYARKGKTLDLKKFLSSTILNGDIVESVSIIDSHGKLVMGNRNFPAHSMPDFSHKEYFIFHSQHNIDSLLISHPLLSALTGKPAMMISRRFNDSNGNFGGVVVLEMDPAKFTSFYAQAKLLPNDIISLISPNGITYARRTGAMESSGEDISKSPLFIHVPDHPDSFYFAPDAIRNIPSWFSYRQLKDYPMIATVGSSEQDILAGYDNGQTRFLTPRIITSVLVILFSVLIALILLHRRRSTALLTEEKERYERLLTEQIIAAQEREREWIGRELHDNINQVLTTVKLYLEMASKQESNPLIPRSMQLINSSIVEIRNLSHQLTAPTLGTRSLIDSINALVEMVGFSTNLLFEFDHDGFDLPLVMSQKLALYRILQEQLNNITKHAQATTVRILLTQKGGNVVLTVRDNGKGFNSKTQTSGTGLHNISGRVKVFGGTAQIETAPGKGCDFNVTFPIITSTDEQPV